MTLDRYELEQWLGTVDSDGLRLDELAEVLHLVLDASRELLTIADAEELRALRFALAVLRDVFVTDAELRAWIAAPMPGLNGRSPADLLSDGRIHELVDLAVREWNRPRAAQLRALRSFAPSVSAR